MNTITLTIAATPDNLKRLADAFGDVIDETLPADAVPAHRVSAAKQPAGPAQKVKSAEIPAKEEPKQKPAKKEAPDITLSQIREKASQLIKQEKREEVKALLAQFEVAKIPDLKESDYPEFLKGLEALS